MALETVGSFLYGERAVKAMAVTSTSETVPLTAQPPSDFLIERILDIISSLESETKAPLEAS